MARRASAWRLLGLLGWFLKVYIGKPLYTTCKILKKSHFSEKMSTFAATKFSPFFKKSEKK